MSTVVTHDRYRVYRGSSIRGKHGRSHYSKRGHERSDEPHPNWWRANACCIVQQDAQQRKRYERAYQGARQGKSRCSFKYHKDYVPALGPERNVKSELATALPFSITLDTQ